MRNIFGNYIEGNTAIHKMNPAVKLLLFVAAVLVVAIFKGVYGFLISLGTMAISLKVSKVPISCIFSSLKGLTLLLIVVFSMNCLFFYPEKAILQFFFLTPSVEGAARGLKISWNIIVAVVMASVVTATTTPLEMTKGIEKLVSPLKIIGVPAKDVATILGISLQFVPIFMDEADRIKKAQMARGASFDGGSLLERAKAVLPLVVPVFVAAFRRADELSTAMEARCYISEKRRKKYE